MSKENVNPPAIPLVYDLKYLESLSKEEFEEERARLLSNMINGLASKSADNLQKKIDSRLKNGDAGEIFEELLNKSEEEIEAKKKEFLDK